jgi:DnaJ-like protein
MRIARLAFPMIALLLFTTTVSMVPAQAQGRQLHINKAIYGKNGQGIDVTNNLRSQIQNNTLNVKVNNKNMGADPNVGADKSVKVEYTYQGRTSTKVVKEGDRLQLP